MSKFSLVLRQLATPLRYHSVKGVAKGTIDFVVPAALTVVSVPLLLLIPATAVAPGGLVERVNELLQVMVGFYVASLAAVSSISSFALDQKVKNAQLHGEDVTRRRFLSLLFGYLSFLSLLLYVGGVLAMLAATPLNSLSQWWLPARGILVAAYSFVCWHLVCVTLLSLHYLVEQVYKPDPVRVPSDGRKCETRDEEDEQAPE